MIWRLNSDGTDKEVKQAKLRGYSFEKERGTRRDVEERNETSIVTEQEEEIGSYDIDEIDIEEIVNGKDDDIFIEETEAQEEIDQEGQES